MKIRMHVQTNQHEWISITRFLRYLQLQYEKILPQGCEIAFTRVEDRLIQWLKPTRDDFIDRVAYKGVRVYRVEPVLIGLASSKHRPIQLEVVFSTDPVYDMCCKVTNPEFERSCRLSPAQKATAFMCFRRRNLPVDLIKSICQMANMPPRPNLWEERIVSCVRKRGRPSYKTFKLDITSLSERPRRSRSKKQRRKLSWPDEYDKMPEQFF